MYYNIICLSHSIDIIMVPPLSYFPKKKHTTSSICFSSDNHHFNLPLSKLKIQKLKVEQFCSPPFIIFQTKKKNIKHILFL